MLEKRAFVETIEFVAVAMALVNQTGAVHALRERARRQLTRVLAQPHRAAKVVHAEQISQFVNQLGRRVRVALSGIGVSQSRDVAGEFDSGPLEAVTDTEVGNATIDRKSVV